MKKLLIITFSIILLTSCGARKVEKSFEKEKVEIKLTMKDTISIKSITKSDSIVKTNSNLLEYEPIDNTLPFIVKGELFQNVRIKEQSKSNEVLVSKVIDSSLEGSKTSNLAIVEDKITSNKTVVKKEPFIINIIWLIVVIVVLLFFLYIKKREP